MGCRSVKKVNKRLCANSGRLTFGFPWPKSTSSKTNGVDAVKILAFSSQSVVISKDGYEKCLSIYYAIWTAKL